MAIQPPSKKDPNAGANKTPAPVDRDHSMGRGGYGANASQTPSSIAPGKTVSQTGINIDAPGGDSVLDAVKAGKSDNWQTRTVDSTPLPAAHGLKNQSNTGPKIPGALIDNAAEPVRKPNG